MNAAVFRALALATASLAALGAAQGSAEAADLRFANKQETPTVDPHFSTNVQAIAMAQHTFDHLIKRDDNMGLVPGLATSWRALDDLTWEFKLRQGVKWHDGTPFTADDVVATVERAANLPAVSSFKQYLLDKTVTKIDDFTIQVKTKDPNPLVPIDISAFGIASKKYVTASTGDFNAGKATVGTGPYKFVEWVQGDRIVFTKNADYWGDKPKWDKVTYKPISADATRVAALKSGDVDIIDIVPTVQMADLKKDPSVVISEGPGNRPWYVWVDSRRDIAPGITDNSGKPLWPNPLRDWRVRKALSLAINRQAIVERVFEGSAAATMQLLPVGFYGYNEELTVEKYDPEGAKKLLAEAGFPQGFQMDFHGGAGSQPNDAKVVEALAQMWTQVGLKTKVNTYPSQVFFDKAGKHEFGIAIRTYSVATGEPSIQLKAVVHTNNWPNTVYCCSPTGYSNPRTDELIEKALVTVDDKAREKLFKDAIGIAVRDYGIIGVYFQYNAWASRKGLKYNTRIDAFSLADNVIPTN